MAIKKIKLPDNTTEDINDPRLPAVTATDNGNLLGVNGGIWSKVNKPSYTLDEVTDGSTRKLANYLPLTGGYIQTGTNYARLRLVTASSIAYIQALTSSGNAGSLYLSGGGATTGTTIDLNFTNVTVRGVYDVWHSGNSNKSDVAWTCYNLTAPSNGSSINAYGTILESGNLFPTAFHIGAYNAYGAYIWSTSDGNSHIQVGRHTGAVRYNLALQEFGGNVGIGQPIPTEKVHVSGNILASGTITPGSDSRIKDNQKDISSENAFSIIGNLKPKTWVWNEKSNENLNGKKAAGLVAQEVEEILPDAVTISENGDIKDFHSLNYNTIQGYEIAAIKGLIEEVKSLKAEIAELKKQIK